MYAGCCDNCKSEIMENQDYSAYGDLNQMKEEFGNCDWIEHEGKHYCPNCFYHDDNDEIIINPKMFKEPKKYHVSINDNTGKESNNG